MLIRPHTNLGFAGGCNLAAEHADGAVLALNPGVVVARGTLAHLAAGCSAAEIGVATASMLTAHPAIVNSADNPVHYLGLAWADGLDDPADHSGPNLPFLMAIIALGIVCVHLSIAVSKLQEKYRMLAEETSLLKLVVDKSHGRQRVP